MVFCKTFYYQEMARIYPPNTQNSECQIFYFLTFSAKPSKFLERTLALYVVLVRTALYAHTCCLHFFSSTNLHDYNCEICQKENGDNRLQHLRQHAVEFFVKEPNLCSFYVNNKFHWGKRQIGTVSNRSGLLGKWA